MSSMGNSLTLGGPYAQITCNRPAVKFFENRGTVHWRSLSLISCYRYEGLKDQQTCVLIIYWIFIMNLVCVELIFI